MRALVMRYAAGKAYTASKCLGVRDPDMTMAQLQWAIIKAQFPDVERPLSNVVHVPVQCSRTRMRCKWCGDDTNSQCSMCGVPLHVKCFGSYHNEH